MIILPDWIESMPDGLAKNKRLNRFYLRLAVLYATPEGRIEGLAELIGINYATLRTQVVSNCQASQKTREGIRRLLGDEFVPPPIWPVLGR